VTTYVFLAVTWGLSFLVQLQAVHAFGWIGAVTFRAFLAGATLVLAARLLRRKLSFNAGWRSYAVVGFFTVAIQLVGLSYAMPVIGTAMTAIFVATIPMFSMIIGQIWGLERITPQRLVGLLLGVAGIVMLVGFPNEPVTVPFLIGCAAALVSSFAAAYGSNYASRLTTTGALEIAAGSFFFGGLMTLPLLVFVPVPGTPAAVDYLYLLTAACIMSALTYFLYFRLVARIGATRAISVEFVVTAVAVVAGAVLLGEQLSAVQLAGGVTIIVGCLTVLGLLPRRRRLAPAA
jgi:drug/metabolite transporter (DMT)-like permease